MSWHYRNYQGRKEIAVATLKIGAKRRAHGPKAGRKSISSWYIIDRGHDGRLFSNAAPVHLCGDRAGPPPAGPLIRKALQPLKPRQRILRTLPGTAVRPDMSGVSSPTDWVLSVRLRARRGP